MEELILVGYDLGDIYGLLGEAGVEEFLNAGEDKEKEEEVEDD